LPGLVLACGWDHSGRPLVVLIRPALTDPDRSWPTGPGAHRVLLVGVLLTAPGWSAWTLWLSTPGWPIFAPTSAIFLAPVLAGALARAATADGLAVALRPSGFRGEIVEVLFVVRSQVPHSGEDDDHDQDDYGCQNDQQGIVVHRTIQPGMALVRRSAARAAIAADSLVIQAPWTGPRRII